MPGPSNMRAAREFRSLNYKKTVSTQPMFHSLILNMVVCSLLSASLASCITLRAGINRFGALPQL